MSKKNTRPASRRKKGKKAGKSADRGAKLIALLAILILTVTVVTASYSWFKPSEVESTGITYKSDVSFRSENCSISHYSGSKDVNGVITYTSLGTLTAGNAVISVTAGTTAYFKTEITNNDATYPTVISLFMEEFPNSAVSASFGVAAPSNSFRTVSSVQTDFYIIRNAFINKNDRNNEDASLSVEWFVKAGVSDVTFDLRKIYLMYN